MDNSSVGASDGPPENLLAGLRADFGDPSLVAEVVGVYLGELPGRLDRLGVPRTAMAPPAEPSDTSAEALRREAHSLKAASALLGLDALASECADLEALIGDGPMPGDAALAPHRAAIGELAAQAKKWLEQATPQG